jgi:hypothetical protein
MQLGQELNLETVERLREQGELLLRTYRAEFTKDPSSRATEASRSNVIAVRHTLKQIYGEAIASDVADLVRPTKTCQPRGSVGHAYRRERLATL